MTRGSAKPPVAIADRHRVTPMGWLFVLFGMLLAVGATGPAALAQEAPTAPAVELARVDPWVRLGDQLRVDIDPQGPPGASRTTQVRVNVHAPLDSSAELADSMEADEGPVIFRATLDVDSLPEPEPGIRRIILDVSATVNEGTILRMTEPGVYPVVVIPIDAEGNEGPSLRTPVIRLDSDEDPESVALKAPDLGIMVDASTTPTAGESGRRPFTDGETARFGRLADLVQTAHGGAEGAPASPFPLTVTTTSDTLTALSQSEEEGAVALHQALLAGAEGSSDGNEAPADDASALIEIVPSTMVAVDLPDFVEARLDHVARDLVAHALSAVEAVVPGVGEGPWIVSGRFDEASAELITDIGYDEVLIGDDDLEHVADDDAQTAPQIIPAGTPVDGLPASLEATIIDTETSGWLMDPLDVGRRPDGAAIVVSELILRSPSAGTDLVVSVGDVPPDSALAAALPLLSDAESPINLRPVSDLGDDASSDDDDDGEAPVALADDAGTDELESIASEVRHVMDQISILTDMLDDRSPQTRARDLLAAAVSSDTPQSRRPGLVDAARAATSGILDRIVFTGTSNLNITSRRSTLPILFDNRNDFPVTVALHADSARLSFPEGDTMTVDLPPGISRIDFPVEALASGSVPLHVELRDATGAAILAEQQYDVRSTAISGVGLLVSFGALVVLIAWWVRTWASNRRRAPGVD